MDSVSPTEREKSASQDKFSVGGIGGLVKMKTLSPQEILLSSRNAGVLLKRNFYNNNLSIPENEQDQQHYLLENKLYESDYGIVKTDVNLTDEQHLEKNFRRHVQKGGEVMAVYWDKVPLWSVIEY